MDTTLEGTLRAFREFAQQRSWSIIKDGTIPSGHQIYVTDGHDKVPTCFYTTGKALIQGKPCDLRSEIQQWWQEYSVPPASAEIPKSSLQTSQLGTGLTSRFYVSQENISKIKQLLSDYGGEILEPTPDPHQAFRAEIRRDSDRVMASQFKTGTLLIQGRVGILFDEVCRLVESVFSQPFAERGARYIPDTEREAALEYLNKPGTEQSALDWTYDHLGQGVFDFLPSNEREGYISGASLLLWLKGEGKALSDYSTVVMPFARAYEGFVIQLAIALGITTEEQIKSNIDEMRAGNYINEVRQRIEKLDKLRYAGIADTLQSAWRDIRCKVLHSDPINPQPHRNLTDAENDVASLNRAMSHAYLYLIERGIIVSRSQKPPKEQWITAEVDTTKLYEQLVKDGYRTGPSQGAKWTAILGDMKIVCPDGANNQVKVSYNKYSEFTQKYAYFQSSSAVSPQPNTQSFQPRIGSDESGKGDYYGPLVIAAVYVDERTEHILIESGVRDSKKIADSRILSLADGIKRLCPYSIIQFSPPQYNDLYNEVRNLNNLLALGHAQALENVLEKVTCELAVADQFGDKSYLQNALLEKGKKIKLDQHPRAEDDIAVAAASVLARAAFIQEIDQLSRQLKITLPKGSSDSKIVGIGREIVAKSGQTTLEKIAKLHFKTTQAILA
jgi:ribonuclease HIII